ncbi:MAG TPA: hypothetical protein VJN18_28615 [Polyangiaceae bacterium]|nr:hypothetical protein [Polyangiaceae bacterium]
MDAAAQDAAHLILAVIQRRFRSASEAFAQYLEPHAGAKWLATLLEEWEADSLFFRADLIDGQDGIQLVELNGPNAGGWVVSTRAEPTVQALRDAGIHARSVDTTQALFTHLLHWCTARAERCGSARPFHFVVVSNLAEGEFDEPARVSCQRRFAVAAATAGMMARLSFAGWERLSFGPTGVSLDGSAVDAIFEEDPEGGSTRLRALREARRGKLALFYGPMTAVLNDKRLLALAHECAATRELNDEECAAVRNLIPWTCRFRSDVVTFDGEQLSVVELAEREPSRWVLKRAASHGGRDVLIGAVAPRGAWQAGIGRALTDGDWVLQRFVQPKEHYWPGDPIARHCVWGVFVIGGRAEGGFVRLIEADGYGRYEPQESGASDESFRAFVMERSMNSDRHAVILPIIYSAAS